MDGKSTPFHTAEPGHLAFGKLVDGCFQLREHLFIGQLADEIKCQILVFQSVIDEVIRLDALLYQKAHFVYHSFFQALVQAAGDFLPTQFPVDVHTYDETVHLGEGTFVYWGMGIILFDFDGSYGTFGCVHVRGIVQAFVTFQYVGQFFQRFVCQTGAQLGILGYGQQTVAFQY